jgi:hypothetical protein
METAGMEAKTATTIDNRNDGHGLLLLPSR